MRANIIKVGNSRGVILPSSLLKRLNLSAKDAVEISLERESIVIKAAPRQGWAAAAATMHTGDDALLIPDIFEDENMEEIEW